MNFGENPQAATYHEPHALATVADSCNEHAAILSGADRSLFNRRFARWCKRKGIRYDFGGGFSGGSNTWHARALMDR